MTPRHAVCHRWIALALASAVGAIASHAQSLSYPQTLRTDHTDTLHGTTVADPYRWLEDDARNSERVAGWVEAQNRVTFGYLHNLPRRDEIQKRLTELWNYPKQSTPFKEGGRYYFYKNDGLQNQYVLYTTDHPDNPPTLLIDPNTWSADGATALGSTEASPDGRFLAYSIQDGGSDWRTWRVLDIQTKQPIADELKWVKFSGVTWTHDSQGFFYAGFDAPQEGDEFQASNTNQKLYYHRLNTPQSEDTLVYHRPDRPEWGYSPYVTEDGRYLVITIWKSSEDKYRVMVRDLQQPYAMPTDLIDSFEQDYSFIGNDGPVFYFLTDYEAPRKQVIAIDTRRPQKERWRVVVPETEHALRDVNFVANQLVCSYLKDASTLVKIHDTTGRHLRDVDLPGIGSASGFRGKRTDTETYYSFQSFTTPPTTYRYDMLTGKSGVYRRAEVAFDPDRYTVNQVFYRSKDGTRVPMFIAHKKGLQLNGKNRTLLYAYGGFNIALTPRFSVSTLQWMEMGGVYALANLRGGGEYGEAWHTAGMRHNKQNVFDDFIAAAEYLIENRYASTKTLGIQGGSNGGLLVGAVMSQRPELFGACLPAVGVMDMLRYHKFTAGRFWVSEYGSADEKEMLPTLLAYSPYHNLKPGTAYPPTLVTTADTDDRVVPGHSFKFAAALQHAHRGPNPVLIRVETRAGHGAGKPTDKIIEQAADQWAFLMENLKP
ncbi:MAG: prolyl oligopeptidase family serine peptidase [Planctomycetota bacterium]|jgi:prolyl oligopeptidase